MRILPIALILFALPLRADGLGDLKNALARLQGRDAARADVELHLWKRKADGGTTIQTQGEGRARIEDGPSGTIVRFAPPLLDQVNREGLEKVKHPDSSTPKTDCMDELGARRLAEYLGYAPVLLRDLEQCHLLGEESVTLDGKPARVLRFSATPSLPTSLKKLLDRLDTDVRIWIESDGTPLAAEINYTYKGSKFFIGFGGNHKERLDFKTRQQRLLVTRHDWEENYQGFGQKNETHKLFKMNLD